MTNQKPVKHRIKYQINIATHGIWDLLTVITLVALLIAVGYFAFIYANPSHVFNPYPPPTPMPENTIAVQPSSSSTPYPTSKPLPATWTPDIPPTTTSTIISVETSDQTATPFTIPSSTSTPNTDIIEITPLPEGTNPFNLFYTPTATLRINYLYRFVLQNEPYAIAASSSDPKKDCNWMGVGGQVFDIQGRPATGINVQFGGVLNGSKLEIVTTLTGSATNYGQAGYEFKIADELVESYLSLWIMLIDQSNQPLSAKTQFTTYKDCTKNLIIINFKQVR